MSSRLGLCLAMIGVLAVLGYQSFGSRVSLQGVAVNTAPFEAIGATSVHALSADGEAGNQSSQSIQNPFSLAGSHHQVVIAQEVEVLAVTERAAIVAGGAALGGQAGSDLRAAQHGEYAQNQLYPQSFVRPALDGALHYRTERGCESWPALNNRFLQESRDDPWALDMEDALRGLWPGIGTGDDSGVYIGCTQALCQVNIQAATEADHEAAYSRLVQHGRAVLDSSLNAVLQRYSYSVASREAHKTFAFMFRRIGHTPADEPEVCRR